MLFQFLEWRINQWNQEDFCLTKTTNVASNGTLTVNLSVYCLSGSLGWTWNGGNLEVAVHPTSTSLCNLNLREYNCVLRHQQDAGRAPERGFIMSRGTQRASQGMRRLSCLKGCTEFLKVKSIKGRENYPSNSMQVGRYGDTCKKKRGTDKKGVWGGEMCVSALPSHCPLQ